MYLRKGAYIGANRRDPLSHAGNKAKDPTGENPDFLPKVPAIANSAVFPAYPAGKQANYSKQDEGALFKVEGDYGSV